jgi:hypothetical protein
MATETLPGWIIQPHPIVDPATLPRRTDDENVKYGVPGHGIPGTTCRTPADIPFVGALVKMAVGDSVAVPPRRLTAAKAWVRTATEFFDKNYIIAPVPHGYPPRTKPSAVARRSPWCTTPGN